MCIASLGTMPGVFGDPYIENEEGENFWRDNQVAYRGVSIFGLMLIARVSKYKPEFL